MCHTNTAILHSLFHGLLTDWVELFNFAISSINSVFRHVLWRQPVNNKHIIIAMLLIITNSTRIFAQNDTHVITERRMQINNNIDTVFFFNRIWTLKIFTDFDEIRYRVPTADWKIWLDMCWSNTFDFYCKKLILPKPSKRFVSYKM